MREFKFCRACRRTQGDGKKHRYQPAHRRQLGSWLERQRARVRPVVKKAREFSEHTTDPGACEYWCPFCSVEVGGAGAQGLRDAVSHLAGEEHARAVGAELFSLGADVRRERAAFEVSPSLLSRVLHRAEAQLATGTASTAAPADAGRGEGAAAAPIGPQYPPEYAAPVTAASRAAAAARAARRSLRPWHAVAASLRVGAHPLGPVDRTRVERFIASAEYAERGETERRAVRRLLERESRFPDRHRLSPDLKAYAARLRWERAREREGADHAGPDPLAALTPEQREVLALPDAREWMPAFGRVWQSGSRRATLAQYRREEAERRRAATGPSGGGGRRARPRAGAAGEAPGQGAAAKRFRARPGPGQ